MLEALRQIQEARAKFISEGIGYDNGRLPQLRSVLPISTSTIMVGQRYFGNSTTEIAPIFRYIPPSFEEQELYDQGIGVTRDRRD
jgi:hypothetical protein